MNDKLILTLVAAVARNGVIGRANDLPWDIPEDRKRFKALTVGKVVLMGRKTFESIFSRLGKPLPGRTNVVVTHNPQFRAPEGVRIYRSLEEALEKLRDQPEVCVIGGGEIYRQTMPLADRLEVTHVDQEVRGDVTFPTIDPKVWKKTFEEKHEGYTFATYEKIRV